MKIETFYYKGIDLTLKECDPSEMVPAYEIAKGDYCKQIVYRYNDKLWTTHQAWSVKDFIFKVRHGQLTGPACERILKECLAAGKELYVPAVEPYYWLDTNNSTINGIVRATCREDGQLEHRRRYAPHEREKAVACAKEIIRMVYVDCEQEDWWPEYIIRVLNTAELHHPTVTEAEGV